MSYLFEFYHKKLKLSNGPGKYAITEDSVLVAENIPLDCQDYLEVGCASGVISFILKLNNPNAKIDAIDNQEELIKKAFELQKINNIYEINFKYQDLFLMQDTKKYDCVFSNPPFLDNSKCCPICDRIKSNSHLQFNINEFVNKMLTLVKSGGVLCFMGHISVKESILNTIKNYNYLEIPVQSDIKKTAKRFIYIVRV